MASTVFLTVLGIALLLLGVGMLAIATLRILGRPSPGGPVWPYALGGFASAIIGDLTLNLAFS
jgi:hypothetical protein